MLLRHVRDPLRDLQRRQRTRVNTVDVHHTLVAQVAQDATIQRRLAAPIRAKERAQLTRPGGEADLLQHLPVFVRKRQSLDGQHQAEPIWDTRVRNR